jgi:hypothetical protein
MSSVDGQNGHLATPCCHPTTTIHTTEMALLVALIVEHNLITGMVDYPNTGGVERILGLLDAHSGAAKALAVWRTAGARS